MILLLGQIDSDIGITDEHDDAKFDNHMKMHRIIQGLLFCLFAVVIHADAPDESRLREAFFHVYYGICANGQEEPDARVRMEADQKILKEAGEERIFELMAKMLNSDEINNSLFPDEGISRLCRIASKLNFSEVFHSAVRECRKRISRADDGWYGYVGLFDYLVKYGDEEDLAWMKKIRDSEDDEGEREDMTVEWIDRFQARLAK